MAAALIRRALAAIFIAALAWAGLPALAQGPLPIPTLTARVIDQTGTLDAAQRSGLETKLAAFEQRKGSQIVVLMVPTTAPEDIASYAQRVGDTWKIGRKGVGDGLLVIVAKDDRKMRIATAKTLEGAVPDLAAVRIIDEEMKPRFRNNDFAGGLNAAVDRLIGLVDGEPLPEPSRSNSGGSSDGFDWENLAIFLFVGVFVGADRARHPGQDDGLGRHGRRHRCGRVLSHNQHRDRGDRRADRAHGLAVLGPCRLRSRSRRPRRWRRGWLEQWWRWRRLE